jgi:hypothetical protein
MQMRLVKRAALLVFLRIGCLCRSQRTKGKTMSELTTAAWAVIGDGRIDVTTIHGTERGAIVNWLCTRRGVLVSKRWSDKQVYEAWEDYNANHSVVRVVVTTP